MFHELENHVYHNEYQSTSPKPDDIVLCYQKGKCLIAGSDSNLTPFKFAHYEKLCGSVKALQFLFKIDDIAFFMRNGADFEIPAEFKWLEIRAFRQSKPEWLAFACVTGHQLYLWYQSRKRCPVCGELLVHSEHERAMVCPICGQTEYPKICPAVIVAVTNGNRLLVTRYASGYKRPALVAGYAEIGETIEAAVHREVLEETGIHVKNLRYYKSQPWSFGDTLLFGFWAEADGDLTPVPDRSELDDASWLTREELPDSDVTSLTGEMMYLFKHHKEVTLP